MAGKVVWIWRAVWLEFVCRSSTAPLSLTIRTGLLWHSKLLLPYTQLTTAEAPTDQCECPYPEWVMGFVLLVLMKKSWKHLQLDGGCRFTRWGMANLFSGLFTRLQDVAYGQSGSARHGGWKCGAKVAHKIYSRSSQKYGPPPPERGTINASATLVWGGGEENVVLHRMKGTIYCWMIHL